MKSQTGLTERYLFFNHYSEFEQENINPFVKSAIRDCIACLIFSKEII